jgi:putative component of membrane protein insertase Oxa1/YidC/SpoIIIJ protein YidD
MAAWRIMRCNPWSQGGVDYVDAHLDSADAKNVLLNSEKPDSIKEVVGAN